MSHHSLAQMVRPGARLTVQRQLVWDVLHRTAGHLTAEQIQRVLAPRLPGFTLPTVYRNLQFLRRAGLVRELRLAEGPVRFEADDDGVGHPHLVCRGCGTIEHLDADDLASAAAAATASAARGFPVQDVEVLLYATCAGCAEAVENAS